MSYSVYQVENVYFPYDNRTFTKKEKIALGCCLGFMAYQPL